MNEKKTKILVIFVIVLAAIILQGKFFNQIPSQLHAWEQTNRFAVSLGFINNGFDFFHPQTCVYNHLSPGKFKVPQMTTITSIDFPINEYIVAVIMKVFNTTSAWCFQIYVLIFSIIGLYVIYLISNMIIKNKLISAFMVVFAMTSPVFVFYQIGFLAIIPSLTEAIIALYLYLKYLSSDNKKFFYWSLVLITLSSLSSLPFVIFLVALCLYEAYKMLINRKIETIKLMGFLTSMLLIVGYFFYNLYLKYTYGTMFANPFTPATNMVEFKRYSGLIFEKWGSHFFSVSHYGIFVLAVYGIIVLLVLRKKIEVSQTQKQFGILVTIVTIIAFAYSCLTLKSFLVYDFIFLGTFFIPALLCTMLIISFIETIQKHIDKIVFAILMVSCIPMMVYAYKMQTKRRQMPDSTRTQITYNSFLNADKFLDDQGVSKDAKILVIDAYAPNLPFVLMNRKGYSVLTTSENNIKSALTWPFEYVIIQHKFLFSDVLVSYPEIVKKLEKVADNERITLYKPKINSESIALEKFMGIYKDKPLVYIHNSFSDTLKQKYWTDIRITNERYHSDSSCAIMTENEWYGATFRMKYGRNLQKSKRTVIFRAFFYTQESINDCYIAMGITANGRNVVYNTYNLEEYIDIENKWKEVAVVFEVPKMNERDCDLQVYLWNKKRNILYYDDVDIKIYDKK